MRDLSCFVNVFFGKYLISCFIILFEILIIPPMSIDYSKLQNKKLTEILQNVPMIDFFPDDIKQRLVNRFAKMNEEGQEKAYLLLKKQVDDFNSRSNEEKVKFFEDAKSSVSQLAKSFDKDVLHKKEEIGDKHSLEEQDSLLDELENL
jgi:hypothetical protein